MVRNLNQYDDEYGDPDAYDDRSYSNSPDLSEYYAPVPEPTSFMDFAALNHGEVGEGGGREEVGTDEAGAKVLNDVTRAQEEQILRMAAEDVRRILGENYSEMEVNTALMQSNYEPEAAIQLLMDFPPGTFLEVKEPPLQTRPFPTHSQTPFPPTKQPLFPYLNILLTNPLPAAKNPYREQTQIQSPSFTNLFNLLALRLSWKMTILMPSLCKPSPLGSPPWLLST